MRQTSLLKPQSVEKKWYVVDAANMVLGRLASQIALVLRGKHKPDFTPHVDCGDYVIVINAAKVKLTGDKYNKKPYYQHSLYKGGLSVRKYREVLDKKPRYPIEHAVRLMLPKGILGRRQFKHLFVYPGSDHPHTAQTPQVLKLRTEDQKILKKDANGESRDR